ncbi:MAG: DinB family protein [Bacteroidota bacterium]
MSFQTDLLRQSRKNLLGLISPFSLEQLNQVPSGFKNNLAWHLGHVIVTHQLICYRLANIDVKVDEEIIGKYRKGTKPEGMISEEEISFLKEQAVVLVNQFEEDLSKGIFVNFKEYHTSFGVILNSTDDSISFNNIHEGLHLGYVMAMRKMIHH